MELLKSIDKYLPTKVSRLFAIWTLPVATGGYFLVDSLSPLISFWQKETITIFQVAVFLLLLLIGISIIAISLIHHVNTRDLNITISRVIIDNNNQSESFDPSGIARTIVVYCLDNDITSFVSEEMIAGIPHTRIELEVALEELQRLNIIDISGYSPMGTEYFLTDNGNQYALGLRNKE